ncbi:MAG: mechanosensitive ion channel family protein [Lachnospiraceae bacterium]|nr:mechanosensitive ion channel family protein [Lachnospiraceae bacterium]
MNQQYMRLCGKLLMAAADTDVDETAEAIAEYAGMDAGDLSGSPLQQILEAMLPAARKLAGNLVVCAVIFFVGTRLIGLLLNMLDKALAKTKVDLGVARFLHSLLRVVLYVFLLFMIAAQLGINTTSIFTILGTAGLAVAMSLQGSLSNVAGGILILLMRPFRLGDYIQTSYGEGTVRLIGMVYTSIQTPDNRVITIPNGELSNTAVTNVTANPKRRLDVTVGVDYGADLKAAKDAVLEAFRANPYILQDEEIVVYVDALADSAVNIGAVAWTATPDYLAAKRSIYEEIKRRLDAAGVSIPFPQVDVHMDR